VIASRSRHGIAGYQWEKVAELAPLSFSPHISVRPLGMYCRGIPTCFAGNSKHVHNFLPGYEDRHMQTVRGAEVYDSRKAELGQLISIGPSTTVSAVCQANKNRPISNTGTVDRYRGPQLQFSVSSFVPVLFPLFFSGLFEKSTLSRNCSSVRRVLDLAADTDTDTASVSVSVSHWAIIIRDGIRNRRLGTGAAPLLCYVRFFYRVRVLF
jgi:hypothetical protein